MLLNLIFNVQLKSQVTINVIYTHCKLLILAATQLLVFFLNL